VKAFIISLSKINSSESSGRQVLSKLLEYEFEASMFEGTYGDEAEELFKQQNRNLHHSVEDKNNRKLNSPGVKGCFYSHFRLWQKCVEMNETISIWEDDVIFSRNFVPVEFKDLLILSLNYDWKIGNEYKTLLEGPLGEPVALDYKKKKMPGASGYCLKPHAAKILINEYKNSFLPADVAINSSLIKLEIHSHLMGRSKTLEEKESLTRSKLWIK
jgi:glycosyl transferase family 25